MLNLDPHPTHWPGVCGEGPAGEEHRGGDLCDVQLGAGRAAGRGAGPHRFSVSAEREPRPAGSAALPRHRVHVHWFCQGKLVTI